MPVLRNDLTKIFVYGTLKRNQPNHDKMIEQRAIFVDEAVTVDKWPLVIATDANLPFLLYKKNHGHNIKGEIYLADKQAIEFLDEFEGLHQNFYSKKKITVRDVKNNEIHEAYCYVLEDFKPYLLENSKYMLDEYDSESNKFSLGYVKRSDTADRADSLIEQVKIH